MGKKKRGILNGTLIFIVISLGIGALVGFFFSTILKDFADAYLKSDNGFIEMIKIYAIFIVFILCFFIQIIIHEGGHLIFGFITGYSFVSFRIGSLTLIKEDGTWKRKKFSIPGTGGQCLMMPPEMVDGKFPFIIYNFGGAILNIVFGVIPILIATLCKGIPLGLEGFLILLGTSGILVALINGIPLKIGGVANDGSNVVAMVKDEEARRAFHTQLKVNGLLSKGERPREMDVKIFQLSKEADVTNALNTSMKLMEYNWYLDKLDFQRGLETLKSMEPYMDRIIGIYKNEIICERIFLELVLDGEKNLVRRLYDKNLRKYIKACKGMISKKRILMAYELLYEGDNEKAIKYFEEGKVLAATYPIKGEVHMEMMLMEFLLMKMDN